jgi:hypothetical protein
MSLGNRLVLPVILSFFAVLAGCGASSSNPTVTPPPSGSFSDSNLSGTYVFSVTGTDVNNNFVTMMGTFTADGKGNISSGVIDVNGTGGSLLGAGITSGSYSVGTDGRPTGSPSLPTGLMTLHSGANVFTFDFVLTSSEHGLMTEFDSNGSGSGTLDVQSNVTQANISGQSYAFNLTGANSISTVLCGVAMGTPVVTPFSTVGAFTLDANGNISTGVADFNNNCVSSGSTNVSVTGGSVTLGSGTTFGKAAITTASAVTFSFDVLAIDSTHLKFIETDAQPTLVGDVFTRVSSIPTGNNVFSLAGFDSSVQGPFTAAGLIVTDGSGNITSGSVEDINDVGAASVKTGFTGSYAALAGGRSEFTLSGFVNGNNGAACSGCLFAVYPSSGGLQMLEIDDGGMTNGIAYTQHATTFASGAGYGMNLSGATSSGPEEDDIAEFTNNSGSFRGIIDFNDQGSLSFKNSYSGNYAADTSVPGRGTVANSKNGPLLTTYVIDSSTSVAVSTDPNMVGLGALVSQNSSAKSNVVANHLAVLRATPSSRMKWAKKKSAATR